MALYISKVKLPNDTEYLIKDAAAWEVLTSFFGEPTQDSEGVYHFPEFAESSEGTIQEIIQEIINNQYITEINEAATYEVSEEITSASTHDTLPTSKAVYDYVYSMMESLPEFDVVIVQGELPTASADTFHKIYLQNASSPATPNLYKEWITIRTGTDPNYSYSWELIGDTSMSLEGYAQEDWVEEQIRTIEIAGVTVHVDSNSEGYVITAAELKNALGLRALAYKDTASGTVADETFSGLKATGTLEATVTGATLSHTSTNATLTTTTYTPAGDVNVTLATTTANFNGTADYTPTGSVSAEAGSTTAALSSVTFQSDNNGSIQIAGTNAASAVTFDNTGSTVTVVTGVTGQTAPTFTEGAFTPASLDSGFYTAGTAASFTEGAFTAATITKSDVVAAQDAVIASYVNTQENPETLVFSTPTFNTVTYVSAFSGGSKAPDTFVANTPAAIDVTKFDGGSKVADTFSAGSYGTLSTDSAIKTLGAATAAAQVFTGNKYTLGSSTVSVLDGNASFEFSGNQATISVNGEYEKATGATAAFVATSTATIVTNVAYDKAQIGNVSVTIANPELTVETFTVTEKTVTVS